MKTASWFTNVPADHIMIGISRGTPRRIPAGYRTFRQLAPGPWFNSVGTAEYCQRYQAEILARLNPHEVAQQITAKAEGRIPVLVCFEQPNSGKWCHRSLAAEWLARALGQVVPEFGFEHLPQHEHPLLPSSDRKRRITESFSKAVEQLGSDKLEVRLGGIYTLEQISKQSEDYYSYCVSTQAGSVRRLEAFCNKDTAASAGRAQRRGRCAL